MKKDYLKLYKELLFNLLQTTPVLKIYAIVEHPSQQDRQR